jgi:DNA-binding NarL/FixJ family response regulator
VPFEGFLAYITRRRVTEVLRRFSHSEECASTDEDWMGGYLAQRASQPDAVAPQPLDGIDHVESMSMILAFTKPLTATETETVALLTSGLAPADIARHRGIRLSAVCNTIARIKNKRDVGMLRAG